MDNKEIRKYIGRIAWIEGNIFVNSEGYTDGFANISRGIKGEDFFNIEFDDFGDEPGGLIKLQTKNNFEFEGNLYYGTDKRAKAVMKLNFYENGKSALLIGQWRQETWIFTAIARLTEVEKF